MHWYWLIFIFVVYSCGQGLATTPIQCSDYDGQTKECKRYCQCKVCYDTDEYLCVDYYTKSCHNASKVTSSCKSTEIALEVIVGIPAAFGVMSVFCAAVAVLLFVVCVFFSMIVRFVLRCFGCLSDIHDKIVLRKQIGLIESIEMDNNGLYQNDNI
jgi:hypothetical protein